MKVYKIRRKSDGLFSTGGADPRFTRMGKTWTNVGHIKNHIKNLSPYSRGLPVGRSIWTDGRVARPHVYTDCEVVAYDLIPIPGEAYAKQGTLDLTANS